MKKRLQGLIAGLIIGASVAGGIGYAASTVRIVIDGQELVPTDADGNRVDPIIIDGTTYLPVRAVAGAFGKAVYWDGPNFTVYLGNMSGKLDYPTTMLKDMTSIATRPSSTNDLTDNYGNSYGSAIDCKSNGVTFEYLLNMKYSRFRGTLYVPEGTNYDNSKVITITADGKQIYASPVMSKISRAAYIDVDITGCNDFKIETGDEYFHVNLADAGFYQ